MTLHPDVLRLARDCSLATVVTLMPDGQPQALPAWVDTDGEYLLVNTEPGRQKVRNVTRDPRITVLLINRVDDGDWAEVRGRVTATVDGPEAMAHLDLVARKYTGAAYSLPVGPTGRVILRIEPHKQNTAGHSGGRPRGTALALRRVRRRWNR